MVSLRALIGALDCFQIRALKRFLDPRLSWLLPRVKVGRYLVLIIAQHLFRLVRHRVALFLVSIFLAALGVIGGVHFLLPSASYLFHPWKGPRTL